MRSIRIIYGDDRGEVVESLDAHQAAGVMQKTPFLLRD